MSLCGNRPCNAFINMGQASAIKCGSWQPYTAPPILIPALHFEAATTMIHRYSSRRSPLKDFLATQLQDARRYDRIAGFFSSSLLEVAGEALERMKPEGGETCVQVVRDFLLSD